MKDTFITEAMAIGLTEDEADNAYYDMGMDIIPEGYCQECGTKLTDGINCNDEYADDYCNNCAAKYDVLFAHAVRIA